MKANLGSADRVMRFILGLGLIAAGILAGLASPWNIVAMAVGGILAVTALIKFCPAYAIIGASTCAKR